MSPLQIDRGFISGDVNFNRALYLRKMGEEYISQSSQTPVIFDFSGTNCNDSSFFAVLLAWMRYAKTLQKQLLFKNMSALLMRVAAIYGILDLLPLKKGE